MAGLVQRVWIGPARGDPPRSRSGRGARGPHKRMGSMYDGCTTRVRAADGYTAPVPIHSGVRQGCPLSPIVFDFAIDSVLRAVTAIDAGFDLSGLRFSTLAYADDIALVADSPEGMQRLLAAAEDRASSVGLAI